MATDTRDSVSISTRYRELEQIHAALADPELPLEEAVSLYRNATTLAAELKQALHELEQELEEIDAAASDADDR